LAAENKIEAYNFPGRHLPPVPRYRRRQTGTITHVGLRTSSTSNAGGKLNPAPPDLVQLIHLDGATGCSTAFPSMPLLRGPRRRAWQYLHGKRSGPSKICPSLRQPKFRGIVIVQVEDRPHER
jgi:acyl CoA:acetate/3-ketoacid CoA transferase